MKRGKKAQSILGMPFSIVFSIILIVFIIVVAFIAIKYFINLGKCGEVGLFYDDLQDGVDNLWNHEGGFDFESTLPSKIEYACFADLNEERSSGLSEQEIKIYEEIKYSGSGSANIFLYPGEKACDMESKNIKHIQVPEKNPYCIKVKSGGIKIKLEKSFEDALVKVS